MAEAITAEAPYLPKPRILRQDWLNLSFLHWAVDPATIAHFFPSGTEPDIFEGRSYVGLMRHLMLCCVTLTFAAGRASALRGEKSGRDNRAGLPGSELGLLRLAGCLTPDDSVTVHVGCHCLSPAA